MSYRHAIILQTIAKRGQAPLGLCPLFVPESRDFLGVYPLAESLRLPGGASELQAEAQLAVFAELEYDAHGQVEAVVPRMAGAFIGASVGEAGMKWSVRKQWGAGSCVVADEMTLLKDWSSLADLRLTCESIAGKAQASVIEAYPWLIENGQAWLAFAMNNQTDGGAFERISTRLAQADRPAHALIALGVFEPPMGVRAGEWVKVEAGESRVQAQVAA